MRVDIHIWRDCGFVYAGYIEMDMFSPERCFNICNWSVNKKSKPEELHANISTISKGICFTNPEDGVIWMPKSIGWLSGDIETILSYVKENKDNKLWL